jgi:hypothetical protein
LRSLPYQGNALTAGLAISRRWLKRLVLGRMSGIELRQQFIGNLLRRRPEKSSKGIIIWFRTNVMEY